MPLMIGFAKAKEFLLLGEWFSAEQAREVGLVNEVLPKEKLMKRAMEVAEKFVVLHPAAFRNAKYIINYHVRKNLDVVFAKELEVFQKAWGETGGPLKHPQLVKENIEKLKLIKSKLKKRKVYHDSFVIFNKKSFMMYDLEGKKISVSRRGSSCIEIKVGNVLLANNAEIELLERVSYKDYQSGKIFLKDTGLNSSNQLPQQKKQLVTKAFRRVSNEKDKQRQWKLEENFKKGKPGKNEVLLFEDSRNFWRTSVDFFLSTKLRSHQVDGVKFLFNCLTNSGKDVKLSADEIGSVIYSPSGDRGCILADEMGLGKTLQALTLLWRMFQDAIDKGNEKNASKDDRERGDGKAVSFFMLLARLKMLKQMTVPFILRRTAEVNREFLPPKNDYSVFLRLSPTQVALYNFITRTVFDSYSISSGENVHRKGLFERLRSISQAKALSLITILRKLSMHPTLVLPKEGLADLVSGADSYIEPAKFTLVKLVIKGVYTSKSMEKVVFVSNSTKALDLISGYCEMEGLKYLRLDGKTPPKTRVELVEHFNCKQFSNPKVVPRVFLLSAKSGGCGLNLTGANRLILLDPDWNPATDEQACARIWREGQTRTVFIYRLLSVGTIEEKIFQRQLKKTETADKMESQTNNENTMARFSNRELRDLFNLKTTKTCNTYELLQGQNSPSIYPRWVNYTGPDILEDSVMKDVIVKMDDLVTWININNT
eukprot:augustus_masked-scaffold_20-processed-gene-5.38-mRNA-1 protein AED:0.12 eAED:0.12 QI:702/0.6/0.5/1/0.8/0.66/6/0/711